MNEGLDQHDPIKVLKDAAPAARQLVREHEVDMRDPAFAHYNQQLVDMHIREACRAHDRHEHPHDEIAGEVLEAQILHASLPGTPGEIRHGWFEAGPITCDVIKTSRYDDMKGVDFVLVFRRRNGNVILALGIDTSFARRETKHGKVSSIITGIEEGRGKDIEYLPIPNSPISSMRIRNAPMFLGVFDVRHVAEMEAFRKRNGNALFKQHPAQIFLIAELLEQARLFGSYAAHKNGADHVLSRSYADAESVLSELLAEKLKRPEPWMRWGQDDRSRKELSDMISRLTGFAPQAGQRTSAGIAISQSGHVTRVETRKPPRKILK